MQAGRKWPIGAEWSPAAAETRFRVWAPKTNAAAVLLFDATNRRSAEVTLTPEPGGYFSGATSAAMVGTRYRYRLAHGEFPDPASRFQPDGPQGPSQVMSTAFVWTDQSWTGQSPRGVVLYELHLGTFTPAGTWAAAEQELSRLAELGITMIEIMPIADMPGRFGWGYDGVGLFAPSRLYGDPASVKSFVDRAHALGLGVILDVVYNHLGPDGNYLREFSDDYFSTSYQCEWGQALNFDGPGAAPVREFFVTNACYWIDEFHFDGLRLDATQQIFDASPVHVLAEIATAVRRVAPHRRLYLVGENEPQHARLVRPVDRGGCGLDALWNDDFHHTAVVAATGRSEGYYLDYRGHAQEFISAAKYGFLFQGTWCRWQRQRRGTPALDLVPQAFVHFLQNHDQVANTLRGLRLPQLTSAGRNRALTAVTLLLPGTPLLFQGQEFGASTPFLYFADHRPELRRVVAEGRRRFLEQFRTIAAADAAGVLSDPADPSTFARCKLDPAERERNRDAVRLHADLLRLRREDPAIRAPAKIDGAVLSDAAWVLRYFSATHADRLLLVNLGAELHFNPAPEPLLAPLEGQGWSTLWSSESPAYGGSGSPDLETTANWILPGHAAFVLQPDPARTQPPDARLTEND